jgi:HK97 family phage prohead protease
MTANQDDFTQFFTPKSAAGTPGTDEKFQAFSVKSINTEQRRITAVASSEIIDRDNEIVSLAAIKAAVKEYMKNPVILAGHSHRLNDGRSPVVGSVVDYKFQGKDFVITVEFADTELGREYWELYKNKHQRAFSMGFGVHKSHEESRGNKRVRIIDEIELYEISAVAVPANPAALAKAKSFVQQKRIERDVKKILDDADVFEKLLDKFDQLSSEYGDPFGNIPEDSYLWEKFSAAEIEILKDLEKSSEGWGFDEDFPYEDCCGGDIKDESDVGGGDFVKAVTSDSGASDDEIESGGDDEPDYFEFFV